MDLKLLLITIVGAGLVVVFLMEVLKRQLKKAHEQPLEELTEENKNEVKEYVPWHIPSWIGLLAGLAFSCVVSFLFFMAWIQPSTIWVYLIHTIAVFLFQYFVSMEFAKRIMAFISKRQGIDIAPLMKNGGD
nr:hypothetical protein [uncultured Sphaerochaeta sp.]